MTTREKAVAYWQDRLGKFFPTAKGPSGVEIDMYRAGYAAGSAENSHLRSALSEVVPLIAELVDEWRADNPESQAATDWENWIKHVRSLLSRNPSPTPAPKEGE